MSPTIMEPVPTVTTAEVAALLQRSERFVLDLNREKKIPSPLQIAGATALLWSRLTIEKWIAAGTPTAAEYEEKYGDDNQDGRITDFWSSM